MTVGLLTKSSELTVMKACGISLYRAAMPILVFGLVWSAALFAIEETVLAHANLGVNFGLLEYLLVLPRYHHWQNARDQAYVDVNYAIHLPLVDMLMGTFKLPPARQWPDDYGVLKLETVPPGIWRQHVMPFRPRK